ncbi:MAG: type II toxin-antitoxin system mRNA interferase toxin, RelE/StbE family [bacterium]|nr:type II toxin-antitoxin system mRNA interferase toxin, RelE/StbE family [bacterium]
MRIAFHKNFDKCYKKLTDSQQNKTQERLVLFLKNPFDPILRNHPLKGKYLGYRSIDIAGDLRAVYKSINFEECIFVILDTHSNLYK